MTSVLVASEELRDDCLSGVSTGDVLYFLIQLKRISFTNFEEPTQSTG